jgi:sugar phosphate isomerase/epimerase
VKLGICSWSFARSATGRRDVGELAEIAANAGFERLEAAFAPRGAVSLAKAPPARLAIPVTSLATLQLHRFSLAATDPRHREAARQTVLEMLSCAVAWGRPSVSISVGAAPPGEAPETVLERLVPEMAPLVAEADRLRIQLSVENVPGHLLEQRSVAAALLNSFPTVGLCLDVGNALLSPPLSRWRSELGHRVTKIHLSDGRSAAGWSASWPGTGDVNWHEVRSFLSDCPAEAVFVEVPWDGTTPEAVFVGRVATAMADLLEGALT